MLQKVLGWVAGIGIIVWVIHDPTGSANAVKSVVGGLVAFFSHL